MKYCKALILNRIVLSTVVLDGSAGIEPAASLMFMRLSGALMTLVAILSHFTIFYQYLNPTLRIRYG
jgi:hypothetical protein